MDTPSLEPTTLLALSNDLAAAVERASRAVVAVNARRRLPSTGVHWRPGIIVTAHHTVTLEEEISLGLPDGSRRPATLAGRDPGTDLAVLRMDGAGVPVAEMGDTASLAIGHIVLALGNGPRVSWGVISGLGGPWQTWRGGQIDRLVRLDLTLYPGFSGGPLVTSEGRVLGINTSGLSRFTRLAVPVPTVDRVVDELLQRGRIARGYLGLGLRPVRLPEALQRKLPIRADVGLVVLGVEPGGPAAQAGLLIGDILIAVDGNTVTDVAELQGVLGRGRPGSTVTVSIIRGGEPADVAVTVGTRPDRRR